MKSSFYGYQQMFHSHVIKINFPDIIVTKVDKNWYYHCHMLAIKYDEKSICSKYIAKSLNFDRYIFYSSLHVFMTMITQITLFDYKRE